MEVARKEVYHPEEAERRAGKKNKPKTKGKTAKKKEREKIKKQQKEMQRKYRREKVLFSAAILLVSFISLGLLLRYVMITEARHDLHQLNAAITELQNDERGLRVEVESLSRSNRVELEAVERLGMTYPAISEVNYIEVDQGETEKIAAHLDGFSVRENPEPGLLDKANENMRQWLSKIEALF